MIASRQLSSSLTTVVCLALLVSCAEQAETEAPQLVQEEAPMFAADTAWPVLPADWEWGQVIGNQRGFPRPHLDVDVGNRPAHRMGQ